MSTLSAARTGGVVVVVAREVGWWLRAIVGAPASFPRFWLLAGLLGLGAVLSGHTRWALLGLALVSVLGLMVTAWRRYAPASFSRLVRDPWRRRRVARWLRRSWSELMAGCGLARGPHFWWLNVRVSTLVGGSTGAGKGSVMWGLLVGLAPAIHAGTVRVHGVDSKGGMELALGGSLFTSWATEGQ